MLFPVVNFLKYVVTEVVLLKQWLIAKDNDKD